MSRRVRTSNVEAQIRARSRAGLSGRQIAAEMGLSRQTIDRALASKPADARPLNAPDAARKQKASPPASPTAAAADLDELRLLMAELARGLTAQARAAAGTDDVGAYATLASKAQSAIAALAKLSPPAPEAEQEGIYVSHADMAKAAASARTAILERIARRAKGDA